MVLNTEITKKICTFIKVKPRTIQEISELIKKNWRTAERYVEKIEQETGSISTRVFREGTRGALKIVYWNSIEEIRSTSAQAELFDSLIKAKRKVDFSPFDIYQYVSSKKRRAYAEDISKINTEVEISQEQDLVGFLRQASNQVFIFSGNLSFINCKQGEVKIIDILRELAKRNISIKIISRVAIVGVDNVKKLLAINKEVGKDIIEIKHRYQPLRAIIVDDKAVKLREVKDPEYYPTIELSKKIEVFYDIYDKEWVEWLHKVFWKMFSSAMPAEKRIKEIESIRNLIQ